MNEDNEGKLLSKERTKITAGELEVIMRLIYFSGYKLGKSFGGMIGEADVKYKEEMFQTELRKLGLKTQ